MIRRPPRSPPSPTRRSSDLPRAQRELSARAHGRQSRGRRVLGHEVGVRGHRQVIAPHALDRKSTRLNSSHMSISYAVFCLKKKNIVKVLLQATSTSVGSATF